MAFVIFNQAHRTRKDQLHMLTIISRIKNRLLGRSPIWHALNWGELTYEIPVTPGFGTQFEGKISIGAFTYFNKRCEIYEAEIGRYCSIGQGVIIGPGEHPTNFVTTHPLASDPSGATSGMSGQPQYEAMLFTEMSAPSDRLAHPPVIGNDVWIGAKAIILRGVTIGDGAIIAAGAVVTKDVAPYEIVGGVAAKHLKWRFDELLRERLAQAQWWNLDLAALPHRDYSNAPEFLDDLERVQLPIAEYQTIRIIK